jgi:hypothetical protein
MKSMIKTISVEVVATACLLILLSAGIDSKVYALPPICVSHERVMCIAKDGSSLTTVGESIVILQDPIEPNLPRKAKIRDINGKEISISQLKELDFIAVKGLHYKDRRGGASSISAIEVILLPKAMSRDEMMKYSILQPLCEKKKRRKK